MSDFAIEMNGLTRDFGSRRAVDHLSLKIPAGSAFAFLGHNGAGKTTTIHLLLGLLQPTEGSALVLGFDTRKQALAIRNRSGALLEHTGLYERLSAEENLTFYGRVWHMSSHAIQERMKELLTPMDLWERRHEYVGTWSRGMKQKLAIARALLHRPPLVFLDEPTDGLDPVSAANLNEYLLHLCKQEGLTLFLTTHNLPEVEKLCQNVALLRQGRVIASGSPDELRSRVGGPGMNITARGLNQEVLRQIRTWPEVKAVKDEGPQLQNGEHSQQNGSAGGTSNGYAHIHIELRDSQPVAPLVARLVHLGVEIEEVRKGTASLEEAYLSLLQH
jgi:ABC-2 type transport system ATP-binding protein